MDFNYQINHENGVILIQRRGSWSVGDFLQSFESLRETLAHCQDYDLVSDLLEVHASFSPTELAHISQAIIHRPLTQGHTLLLVNKPIETALAMLYRSSLLPVAHISIFSTIEGASEYLGYDLIPMLSSLSQEPT